MVQYRVTSQYMIDNGITDLTVFDTYDIMHMELPKINKISGKNAAYLAKPITFDIETSTIDIGDDHIGYMYVWQAAIFSRERVVMGRYWDDWFNLVRYLNGYYGANIVCYVHNLGYEAQFMRNFIDVKSCFAVDDRKPVKILTDDGTEYRCSYRLSNMSLDKFCEKSNVKYQKQTKDRSGQEYDYRGIYLPTDKLTTSQIEYCYCDAAGLYEAVEKRLDTHNIVTIPLTSTGYVREAARNALKEHKKQNHAYFIRTKIDAEVYELCKNARRGGNCHANPYHSGKIIPNVRSRDKKSSYPYEMLTKKYPMSLRMEDPKNFDWHYYEGRAIVMQIVFEGLNLKNHWSIPYLSVSKGYLKRNVAADNGRVLSADLYGCYITEVDYRIIQKLYDVNNEYIVRMCVGEKEYLPKDFRECVMKYFAQKEALTGVDEYLRNRKKNEINALFGMLLTDICHDSWIWQDRGDAYVKEAAGEIQDIIDRYYRNSRNFAAYQQGLYVTAYGRMDLQEGLDLCSEDLIYTDTDSAKYTGDHEDGFERINARIRADADNYDVKPYLPTGEYLGVWEREADYQQFATCGAKKYGGIIDGKLEITIAGCNKDKGKEYIAEHWGLDAFKLDNVSKHKVVIDPDHSGRLTAYYNDYDAPRTIKVRGQDIVVGSNIGMVPATYTLGISGDYDDLLTSIEHGYDFL